MSEVVFGKTSLVPLPTKGLFYREYGNPFPDGYIEVVPLTTAVDKALAAPGLTIYDIINIYIGNGAKCPPGFLPDYFTQGDRMALLFAIRAVSSGVDYDFQTFCKQCGKQTPASFHIPHMEFFFAEEEDREPFSTVLPIQQKTVEFRLPRGTDQRMLDVAQKDKSATIERSTLKQIQAGQVDVIHTQADVISRLIVSVDGRPVQFRMELRREMDAWPKGDLEHLDNAIDAVDPRPDLEVSVVCVYCRAAYVDELPILPEFFRSKPVRTRRHSRAAFASSQGPDHMVRVPTDANLRADNGPERSLGADSGGSKSDG